MKKIAKSAWEYDFFPYPASLRVGNQEASSTFFGQLVTKIILIIVIALFISQIVISAKKENPKVLYEYFTSFDRPTIILNPTNFRLAFQILDKFSSFLYFKTSNLF